MPNYYLMFSYASLLALADSFLATTPRNVKCALHCLQSIFALPSVTENPVLEARTHLQVGQLLRKETNNQDLAKHHIEQAVSHPIRPKRDLRPLPGHRQH
jgi:MAternally-affected-uncoordination protein